MALLTGSVYGQSPKIRFKTYSIEQGLSQSSVNAMARDAKGFLWVGTQDGLNRFDGYEFKVFRKDPVRPDRSLVNNSVEALLINRDGVMWVGTMGGLCRFDPALEAFTAYVHDPEKPLSPAANRVECLFEDNEGKLWIGTSEGVLILMADQNLPHFKNYMPAGEHGAINAVMQIESGKLLVATDKGLETFDPQTGSWAHHHDTRADSDAAGDPIEFIFRDPKGDLFVGGENGLRRFNGRTESFVQSKPGGMVDQIRGALYAMAVDSEGGYWFGSPYALLHFDPKRGRLRRIEPDDGLQSGLNDDAIQFILTDKSGVLWLGAISGGINKMVPAGNGFDLYQAEAKNPNSLSSSVIASITMDHRGVLWVGTFDGGLNRVQDHQFQSFVPDEDLSSAVGSKRILSLYEDSKQTLWVGMYRGLATFDESRGQFNMVFPKYRDGIRVTRNLPPGAVEVNAMLEDRQGRFWVGTAAHGLHLLNRDTHEVTSFIHRPEDPSTPSENGIRQIIQTRDGDIWLAMLNGGVNRITGETPRFSYVLHQPGNPNSLSDNRVFSLLEGEGPLLWIGTNGGGLNRYNRDTGQFRHYRTREGLPNDTVYAILADDVGRLWMSTNKGLAVFDPVLELFRNYDVQDGLQSNEFNQGAYYKGPDGRLYFGGVSGLNVFDPQMVRDDPHPPQIELTNFYLFNQPMSIRELDPDSPLDKVISETQFLELNHEQQVFGFQFAGMHHGNPQKHHYAYRMDGFDQDWIQTDASRRFAVYTNLDPGSYTFRVKGCNKDGVWNLQGRSLSLRILPPPWLTWQAYVVYIFLGMGALGLIGYGVYHRREHDLKHVQVEQLREIDKLKDEFLAKTSHELRTPLNGIIGLAESLMDGAGGRLPSKARADMGLIVSSGRRLASLVNDILDFSKLKKGGIQLSTKPVDFRSLADVVLTHSLPLVGEKPIQLINQCPPDLPPVQADENRLQQVMHNLVGNAVKFTESGKVTIAAGISHDMVEVRVCDTGIGIEPQKLELIFESFEQGTDAVERTYGGTGLGLAISRFLIDLHGGTIRAESSPGQGATFIFTLPLAHTARGAVVDASVETTRPALPLESEEPEFFEQPEEGAFHILVVDDEMVNRRVLANHLSVQHFRHSEVASGAEALAFMEAHDDVDLIFLDIMMPKMSGFEVCRRLRETYSLNELPILFLSAKNQVKDLEAGLAVGANDYLTKPINKNELLARLRIHLELLKMSRDLELRVAERTAQSDLLLKQLQAKNEELHHAYQQLILREKMASLGSLTAGIAHEIKNPTSFAYLSIYNIETELDAFRIFLSELAGDDADPEILSAIEARVAKLFQHINLAKEGTRRIKVILHNLNAMSHREGDGLSKTQFTDHLEATIMLAKTNYKHQVDFVTEFDDPLTMTCRVDQLSQVFMNLIVNGCQAIVQRQKDEKSREQGKLIIRAYKEDNQAVIQVEDTGMGVPPEHREQIFQPMFTTKPKGEGTGLGLPISKSIVEEHGGSIELSGDYGKGAVFTVRIPLDPPKS